MEKEKHSEKKPEKKLSREDRIEELSSQILKAQEAINVFREQYEKSKVALKESDEIQNEQIAEILNKLPAGATPKGVLDDILKAATPQRTQIINNISKLSASVKIQQINLGKLQIEKSTIEKQILEERLTVDVKELCEMFSKFQETWIEMEETFIRMRDFASALSIANPKFSERVPKDYPSYYLQVFSSLFNAERLSTLSIPYLVENVSNYGQGLLAQGNMSIRRMEERHVFEDNRPQDKTWRGPIPNRENEEAE